ncbi:hypothetical protein ACIBG8_42875 [Nonomuraea sp. NPDC050556]|uniref:hypothetical protein n=1 Tax=Nonomuraea sp. NPDC050556 TaxID=3364369 RepID=UPI0037A0E457
MSRFLSGERIPPWDFVSPFLDDVAERRDRPMSSSELQRAQDLRMEALRVSNALLHEAESLRGKLGAAETEKAQAEERLTALLDLIAARRGEMGEVRKQTLAIESSWSGRSITARGGQELEVYQSQRQTLAYTQGELEAEIEQLKADLDEARAAKEIVEQKCRDLEAALIEARRRVAVIGGLVGRPDFELPSGIMAYVDDRRSRWGGVIGICLVPAIIYGLPAYLGFMYQLLPATGTLLRSFTLGALAIPIWFAYGIKRLERAGLSKGVHLLGATLATSAIFLAGTLIPIWR